MTVGSLFSGAGLMDWGLTLAGFDHAWFCESDPFCRRVLERRWPGVPIYEDVRSLVAPERVDLLAGGFPCQDVSVAGRRTGISGPRSGLWTHFARLIGELRPSYVFVENVPGLLVRGMGTVLGDLASLGYDAEWDCLPAAAFGAPHLRARIFILAYPDRGLSLGPDDTVFAGRSAVTGRGALADANGRHGEPGAIARSGVRGEAAVTRADGDVGGASSELANADSKPPLGSSVAWAERNPWAVEPDVGRMAHGVPARVDRLRALGNGVVPQISRYVGERILEREGVIA